MAGWIRRLRFLGPLAAGIAGAVWGYRLVTKGRESTAPDAADVQYSSLEELLSLFRSEDIANCLRRLGLPTGGTKRQRIDRIIDMAALPRGDTGWTVSDVLAGFREADLERVCLPLGVAAAAKDDMVKSLAARVAAVR